MNTTTLQVCIEQIEEEQFVLNELYTVIIYFKDANGNYLMDERLPHGHRQSVVIDKFPFYLDFQLFSDSINLENIQIVLLITRQELIISGMIETDLIVNQEELPLEILTYEITC